MSRRSWTSNAKSHPGSVRAVNEDAFLNEPSVGLWCVADGMGGHAKGDVASALIVNKLSALLAKPIALCVDSINHAIQEANKEIIALSKQHGATIGSTVAVLFIQEDMANVLWAGDSRIYHFSDNKLTRVTNDHNQAQELVMHGLITPEQAQKHPGSNLITRAVGTQRSLSLEHKTLRWKATDKFVVCTDGLNGVIEDTVIEAQLINTESTDLSELLINCALERRALDNVTVIAVHSEQEIHAPTI